MTLTNPASNYETIGDGNAPVCGFPGYAYTLTDDLTLDATYENFLTLDPGGSDRDVVLDAELASNSAVMATGLFRGIENNADADGEELTVKNDAGGTVATLYRFQCGLFHLSSAGTWRCMGVMQSPAAGDDLYVYGTLYTDTISEITAGGGVVIDGTGFGINGLA